MTTLEENFACAIDANNIARVAKMANPEDLIPFSVLFLNLGRDLLLATRQSQQGCIQGDTRWREK